MRRAIGQWQETDPKKHWQADLIANPRGLLKGQRL